MQALIREAKVFENGRFVQRDLCLLAEGLKKFQGRAVYVMPGFADVHVHFREPGFSYKETIETGSLAAAHGGYCAVCTMPNLDPVPDSYEHLLPQLELIQRDARVRALPYGSITIGEKGTELSDMEALAPYVCAFSDDGRGVQNEDVMRSAMRKTASLGKLICAHCEDNSLLHGGYIHQGGYAAAHGHAGISSESEWRQIERDLRLVRETGCAYHVCHISTRQSVELIRNAKREGLDVSCETAPHYLILTEEDLREDGRFKMNPPLRGTDDRTALLEGLSDGTIDMIATDHAPHGAQEKARGLKDSVMGVVGLETAFPMLYTHLVKPGDISLEKLVELMHTNPCRRFGIRLDPQKDYNVYDLDFNGRVDPGKFLSKGRSTPFEDMGINAKCLLTVSDGKVVWQDEESEV